MIVSPMGAGFLPHGYCYLWNKPLLWTHLTSDVVIGVSYTAISLALGLLLHRTRREIPFSSLFIAFGVFIIACGATHFMEVWTLWQPHYWLAGGVKVVTAVASVATAIAMPFVLPNVQTMVRDAHLSRAREWAAGRAAALEDANLVLQRQATQLTEQRTKAEALATELEQANEELRAAKRLEIQLLQEQKMEAVGRLAGGIAHDFNNMLTSITGFGELILDTLPPHGKNADDMREILREASRAGDLTRQLLTFSRRQPLAPHVLDLNETVSTVCKMLRRLIGENIELRTMPDHTPVPVLADAGQIEQVIVNLAVNARDAMPHGGRLTIETVQRTVQADDPDIPADMLPGQYALLTVRDTGVGMDSATQDHIFEPFFTTKAQGKGTGLGLATVYGVVHQSGGHIWVYSALDRGTTFKLFFPLASADDLRSETEAPVAQRTGGHETVLVVEDEDGVRRLMSQVLERYGYQVLLATNGISALELLATLSPETQPIDLVITDVIMPRMSGPEFVMRMMPRWPGTRILYTSGHTRGGIPPEVALDPGTHFMMKPFTLGVLLQRVRETLAAGTTTVEMGGAALTD